MGEVKNIADANFGISPQLLRHVEQFEAEIWESMADANQSGRAHLHPDRHYDDCSAGDYQRGHLH